MGKHSATSAVKFLTLSVLGGIGVGFTLGIMILTLLWTL